MQTGALCAAKQQHPQHMAHSPSLAVSHIALWVTEKIMKRLEISRSCKLVRRWVVHYSDCVILDKFPNFLIK